MPGVQIYEANMKEGGCGHPMIVPLDNHADMDSIMTLFFDTREARDRAIRIRVLFDNVNVLIGDFDECSGPRRE